MGEIRTLAILVGLAAGCGGAAGPGEETEGTGEATTQATDGSTSGAGSTTQMSGSSTSQTATTAATSGTTQGSGGTTGIDPSMYGCHQDAPAGAETPPQFPTYEATCPPIVPGFNTLASSGNPRTFLFVAPADLQPDERVPLFFMWHWLAGEAMDFYDIGDVQTAANLFRFIAVIPEAKGDLQTVWPYNLADSDARQNEEYRFFDDMFACVAQQYNVNANCVSSVGVSAGALFTSQLAGARGQHLSSIMSLSGGVGGVIKGWSSSPHKMPAMVLWGGPSDSCAVVNFEQTSKNLETALQADGHSILECIHNCGHAEPPFEVPGAPTPFAPLWEYALEHPYWLEDGVSPYDETGVPDDLPPWCALGPGNAVIREGECPGSAC